jgi:DNA replication protein DnaC
VSVIGIKNPRLAAVYGQIIATIETPEYQKNARRLEAEYASLAESEADRARRLRLIDGRVPQAFWDTVRDPQITDALAAVKHHLTAAPRECVFLALAGPRGRGKTTALACAVAEYGGLYIEAHELVRVGTFDDVWDEAARAPVLVIDELGAEFMNDAYRASLYELLNTRYSNNRKTIIATNLDAQAFRMRYCPDANDRLAERIAKGGRWFNLPGESMRRNWQEK